MRLIRSLRAFTLLELLTAVALAIILLGSVTYVFFQASDVFNLSNAKIQIFQNARVVLDTMEQQLGSATLDKSNRYFVGTNPALVNDQHVDVLEFASSIYVLGSSISGTFLYEIGYQLNTTYQRVEMGYKSGSNLDLSDGSNAFAGTFDPNSPYELGYNVKSLSIQYVNDSGALVDTWDTSSSNSLPRAVKVAIRVTDDQQRETVTFTRIIFIG